MDQRFRKNMSAPNLVNVCIDAKEKQGSRGRLYSRYQKEPVCFENEYQLLKLLDELMEHIGYPQSAVEMRSYREMKKEKPSRPDYIEDPETLVGYRGDYATFLIHVKYRQNATWQGEVCWAEQGHMQAFRSALELLKLIDSVQNNMENLPTKEMRK